MILQLQHGHATYLNPGKDQLLLSRLGALELHIS